MRFDICKIVLVIVAIFIIMQTIKAEALPVCPSPNKILIHEDTNDIENVYLYKYSIVKVKSNIKRAMYVVGNDSLLKEYTADYNCSKRSIHVLKCTIKEDNKSIGENELDLNINAIKGTIYGNLIDTVCMYNKRY